MNVFTFYLIFSFFFSSCKLRMVRNEWMIYTDCTHSGAIECVRICAYNHANLFPLFQSFSCWFYPAHSPRDDMIAMWIEDRCEMVGQKKQNENEMKKRNKRMKQFAKWTKHWKMARKSTTVAWGGGGAWQGVYGRQCVQRMRQLEDE